MLNGRISVRCFRDGGMHNVGSSGPAYITFHKHPIDPKGDCIISLPGILHISAALLTQPPGFLNSVDPDLKFGSMQKPTYMITRYASSHVIITPVNSDGAHRSNCLEHTSL